MMVWPWAANSGPSARATSPVPMMAMVSAAAVVPAVIEMSAISSRLMNGMRLFPVRQRGASIIECVAMLEFDDHSRKPCGLAAVVAAYVSSVAGVVSARLPAADRV